MFLFRPNALVLCCLLFWQMFAPSFVVWLSWQALLYFPLIDRNDSHLKWESSLWVESTTRLEKTTDKRRTTKRQGRSIALRTSITSCHLSLLSYFCLYCRRNHGGHSVRWRKRRKEAGESGEEGQVRPHHNPVPNPNPNPDHASHDTACRLDDDSSPVVGVQHTIHPSLKPADGVQHTTDSVVASPNT